MQVVLYICGYCELGVRRSQARTMSMCSVRQRASTPAGATGVQPHKEILFKSGEVPARDFRLCRWGGQFHLRVRDAPQVRTCHNKSYLIINDL